MCAHVYDVALFGNTVKKCGSQALTGWPPPKICMLAESVNEIKPETTTMLNA